MPVKIEKGKARSRAYSVVVNAMASALDIVSPTTSSAAPPAAGLSAGMTLPSATANPAWVIPTAVPRTPQITIATMCHDPPLLAAKVSKRHRASGAVTARCYVG